MKKHVERSGLVISEAAMKRYDEEFNRINALIKESARQLNGVYETHGRDGLRGHSDGSVLTLLLAKKVELGEISLKIESGKGQELDVLLKSQLESQVRDLGMELNERPRAAER